MDEFVLINKEMFGILGYSENFKKANPMTIWIDFMFRCDNNASLRINKNDYNLSSLKELVKCEMIDIYRYNTNYLLVVVRPSEYTDIGSFWEPDYPIASSFYHDARRSEPGYGAFRKAVLNRDKHKCRLCGCGDDLEVHHIKEYVNYPELRTKVSNGITLCKRCHKLQHKKVVRRNVK